MNLVEQEGEVHSVLTGRETWNLTVTPDFIRGYSHAFAPGREPIRFLSGLDGGQNCRISGAKLGGFR